MKLTEIYKTLLIENIYYTAYHNIHGFLMNTIKWSLQSKTNKPDFNKLAHSLNVQSRANVKSLKTYNSIEKELAKYLKSNWISDDNPYDVAKQSHIESIIDICHPHEVCNCSWCTENRGGKIYVSPEESRSEKLMLKNIIARMEEYNNEQIKFGRLTALPDKMLDDACADIVDIYKTNLYTGRYIVRIDRNEAIWRIKREAIKASHPIIGVPRFYTKIKKFMDNIMQCLKYSTL